MFKKVFFNIKFTKNPASTPFPQYQHHHRFPNTKTNIISPILTPLPCLKYQLFNFSWILMSIPFLPISTTLPFLQYYFSPLTVLLLGGSPDLVVMGGDSCSKGCEFESLHPGHFFTHLSVLKFVMCV